MAAMSWVSERKKQSVDGLTLSREFPADGRRHSNDSD
jgi:hypothetical protein